MKVSANEGERQPQEQHQPSSRARSSEYQVESVPLVIIDNNSNGSSKGDDSGLNGKLPDCTTVSTTDSGNGNAVVVPVTSNSRVSIHLQQEDKGKPPSAPSSFQLHDKMKSPTFLAREQRLPFGIHRYALLTVGCAAIFLTFPPYPNWSAVSLLFVEDGGYVWKCTEAEKAKVKTANSGKYSGVACDEQDVALSSLFTIAYLSQTGSSFLCGWFFDVVGMKLSGMTAEGLFIIGWILAGVSCESVPSLPATMVMWGIGSNLLITSLCPISFVFPRNGEIVIALLGAAFDLACFWPLIMRGIVNSFSLSLPPVLYIFAAVVVVGTTIMLGLFIPFKQFKHSTQYANLNASMRLMSFRVLFVGDAFQHSPSNVAIQEAPADAYKVDITPELPSHQDVELGGHEGTNEKDEVNNYNNTARRRSCGGSITMPNVTSFDSTSSSSSSCADSGAVCSAVDADTIACGSNNIDNNANTPEVPGDHLPPSLTRPSGADNKLLRVLKTIKTPQYYLFCIMYTCITISYVYFHQAAPHRMLPPVCVSAFTYLIPLSFIICIAQGYTANKLGVMKTIALTVVVGCGALLFGGISSIDMQTHHNSKRDDIPGSADITTQSLVTGFISVLCFSMFACTNQIMVRWYVLEFTHWFDPRDFGALTGIVYSSCGVMSLISWVLYGQVTVEINDGLCLPVAAALALCLLLSLGLIYLLETMARKSLKRLKENNNNGDGVKTKTEILVH
eukprot:GHVS01048893.1.p1 GENE.GHVS01048893.1~~GHVS01048893.1.p1  ORF type:complete len:731 (-),score=110.55 GHVS01048893.1:84-2276(-)